MAGPKLSWPVRTSLPAPSASYACDRRISPKALHRRPGLQQRSADRKMLRAQGPFAPGKPRSEDRNPRATSWVSKRRDSWRRSKGAFSSIDSPTDQRNRRANANPSTVAALSESNREAATAPPSHSRRLHCDFACFDARLMVEVDGATHSNEAEIARDAARSSALAEQGYAILRFTRSM